MTLEELYNELENREDRDTHYIVALKYKYDFKNEYTIENQLLEVDYDNTAHIADVVFIWENDWDEGQTDVEVLGYIPVREVQVAPKLFIAPDIDTDKLEKLFAENPPMIQVVPKTGHWHRLPDTIDDLQDHYFYLVVYPPYMTPMKAKYHVGERMDILGCGEGEEIESVFFHELGEAIKWWTELPEMPQESEKYKIDKH